MTKYAVTVTVERDTDLHTGFSTLESAQAFMEEKLMDHLKNDLELSDETIEEDRDCEWGMNEASAYVDYDENWDLQIFEYEG